MKKGTIVALVVFAGLLALVVWRSRKPPERGITRLSFASLSPKAIDRLEISGPKPIEMSKKGDGWILADGKAAAEKAPDAAVKGLVGIDTADLVTHNPDRFKDLKVDDKGGTHVVAKGGGKVLADVYVGKMDRGGTYVRRGDDVYLVHGLYPAMFSKPAPEWHHLKLFDVKPADVTKLVVALHGEKPYTLDQTKKKDGYTLADPSVLPKGFRFDKNAAAGLVRTLVSARAKTVLETDPGVKTTGLGDGADAFTLTAGKKTYTLLVGSKRGDGTRFAKVSTGTDVYALPKWTLGRIEKKPTDLRDLRFVKIDPEKVSRIEIRNGKMQLVLEKTGGSWQLASHTETPPTGFTFDPTQAQARVSSLASARGLRVADGVGLAKAGLTHPAAEVRVTTGAGKTVVVAFGKTIANGKQKQVYAHGNADDLVYVVSPWLEHRLLGGVATFQKRSMPQGFDRQALIRQLMQQARAKRAAQGG